MKKIIFLFAFTVVCMAQTSTYEFLRINSNPKAAALGGSYVAYNDDPNVMFYNPSGIYNVADKTYSLSFAKHIEDIAVGSATLKSSINSDYNYAAGIKYINYGNFKGADELGNPMPDFGAGEMALTGVVSGKLDSNLYYGAGIKYIFSSIADANSSGIAVDLGANYFIPEEGLAVGLAILNMGSQIKSYYTKKETLPLDIKLGISKKLQHVPLKLSLNFHNLNAKRDQFMQKFKNFTVGAEFSVKKSFKLRLGFDSEMRSDLKIGNSAGMAGMNMGFGLNISSYIIDYSYSSWGDIGQMHQFGITSEL